MSKDHISSSPIRFCICYSEKLERLEVKKKKKIARKEKKDSEQTEKGDGKLRLRCERNAKGFRGRLKQVCIFTK